MGGVSFIPVLQAHFHTPGEDGSGDEELAKVGEAYASNDNEGETNLSSEVGDVGGGEVLRNEKGGGEHPGGGNGEEGTNGEDRLQGVSNEMQVWINVQIHLRRQQWV